VTLPVLSNAYVAQVTRRPVTAVASVRSPFTGTVQVQDWGGEWWAFEIQTARIPQMQAQALAAFLTGLRGSAGRFVLEDPEMVTDSLLGTPQVAGAGQSGRTLVTDGWQPNAVVRGAGQFVSLGSGTDTRLHMVLEDVQADAAGACTLPIWPALRESPADNAPVEYHRPKVQLRLTSPVPHAVDLVQTYTFTISAEEAL